MRLIAAPQVATRMRSDQCFLERGAVRCRFLILWPRTLVVGALGFFDLEGGVGGKGAVDAPRDANRSSSAEASDSSLLSAVSLPELWVGMEALLKPEWLYPCGSNLSIVPLDVRSETRVPDQRSFSAADPPTRHWLNGPLLPAADFEGFGRKGVALALSLDADRSLLTATSSDPGESTLLMEFSSSSPETPVWTF
jgi:hypothetical protein